MTTRAIIARTATTTTGPIVAASPPDTIVAVDQLAGYCNGRMRRMALSQRLLSTTAFCRGSKNWNDPHGIIQIETAEPPVGQVERHLLAQPVLGITLSISEYGAAAGTCFS
jgi:hypothetical protein